jgi:hypothetical protein
LLVRDAAERSIRRDTERHQNGFEELSPETQNCQILRKSYRRARLLIFSVILSGLAQSLSLNLVGSADVLKGGVNKEDYVPRTKAPGLSRDDIKSTGDAFGGDDNNNTQQAIEPPSFDVQTPKAPKPPPNFNLRADEGGGQDFNGTPQQGVSDAPPAPQVATSTPFNPQQGNANMMAQDADSTPQMKLAWDEWHRRVAEAVYQRYTTMTHMAFKFSRPMGAYVTYVVTRDGRVTDVTLQQKSPNVAFNAMIMMVVNSLNGQRDLLAFPQGSRRMTVEKGGMFTQNYGVQGFKFTTGDQ